MFRMLVHSSSGACDCVWVYFSVSMCVGVVSGLQPGHYFSLTAANLKNTANQELNDQCGNQHFSRELLMMGLVVPERC